jgi:hypothetical protein
MLDQVFKKTGAVAVITKDARIIFRQLQLPGVFPD